MLQSPQKSDNVHGFCYIFFSSLKENDCAIIELINDKKALKCFKRKQLSKRPIRDLRHESPLQKYLRYITQLK